MGGYIILYADGHEAFVPAYGHMLVYTHMPAAVEPM